MDNQQIEQFIFTDHAELRWNERVGPFAQWRQLNELLIDLHSLNRIRFQDDLGIIDDEIYFCFSQDSKNPHKAIIQTVLGRLSIKPLLEEPENIRNRYVYLDVPSEIIELQSLPVITEWERVQLEETKEQLTYLKLSEADRRLVEQQVTEMKEEVIIKLNKIKRKEEREQLKQNRLARKKKYHEKYQLLLERIQEQKRKQRITYKCSAFSSMVGRDLSPLLPNSDEVNVS